VDPDLPAWVVNKNMTFLSPRTKLNIMRESKTLSQKEREPLNKKSRRKGSARQRLVNLPALQVLLLGALALCLTVSLQSRLPIVRVRLVVISINMRVRLYTKIQGRQSQMIGRTFPALKVATSERKSM
jgi:hypothetical protein